MKKEKRCSEGYRIITQFFKEIGLYQYFLDYQMGGYKDTSCAAFDVSTTDPIRAFSWSAITYYIRNIRKIRIGDLPEGRTLLNPFIYFCECFYKDYYITTKYHSIELYKMHRDEGKIYCSIDIEKKKITI